MAGTEPFSDRTTINRSNALDSSGDALPVDIAAQHVDADVVSALARWRDVDQFSLHDLAPTLFTKTGKFIGDSPGYLHALHGFVAEKVAHADLTTTHEVVWPDQTNVPAYDMLVDGIPVQVKEGTSAYQAVRHALDRYPDVTSFVTDPSTAEHLRQHGIDALGVDGLNPREIAQSTSQSVEGLSALEQAGQLHIPILTTVFSLCKYWDRYDAEQIDAATAFRFAATDIGAQSVGAAVGLKAAATYVVATGGFGLAVLPLTVGAIAGAMGLRHIVNQNRTRSLRDSLRLLDDTRKASEMAAEIIAERSRRFAQETIEKAEIAIRRENGGRFVKWAMMRDAALEELCSVSGDACKAVIDSLRQDGLGISVYVRQLLDAFAEPDLIRRYLAITSCLTQLLSASETSPSARSIGTERLEYARSAINALHQQRATLEAEAASAILMLQRNTKLDLISEYALLLVRLSSVAKPTIDAIERVRAESDKLGLKFAYPAR